jgi:hypothetical protein
MHKPETTNRSHSHNRGCTKPETVQVALAVLLNIGYESRT